MKEITQTTTSREGNPSELKIHETQVYELLRQARRRLRTAKYPELRQVGCAARGNVLRLDGLVSRFHLKQMAQHLVRDLDGLGGVENRITVSDRYRTAS